VPKEAEVEADNDAHEITDQEWAKMEAEEEYRDECQYNASFIQCVALGISDEYVRACYSGTLNNLHCKEIYFISRT
jgi:hypothetical protein